MDAENLFRLKHEFRALANFEHENFIRFGELSCEGGQWFFTMERIHGRDFLGHVRGDGAAPGADEEAPPSTPSPSSPPPASSSRLRAAARAAPSSDVEPPSPAERRLRLALAQLVDALAALHESGRIHRDVKPSNVLVTAEGRVVLLDFGLMTGFGLDDRVLGTPAYMAPEQIACEPLTPAADWYALGVMMYAALTGRLPFEGKVHQVMFAKVSADPPADWQPSAPEDLRALCLALLAREPSARPAIDEIRARLGVAPPARQRMREVFIGREAELGRLRRVLAEVQGGTPRAVVVRGEPGMGKSMLVERFLAALPPQTVVLRGRCYEQESVPFGGADTLVDALSEYLLGLAAGDVEALLAGGGSNVALVFPVLRRVEAISDRRSDGPTLSPATLRQQAFEELASLVAALARTRTLVVYVDDLQWLDADSLALVRAAFLPDGATGARCLFVATSRCGAALSPGVAEFVASLEAVDVPRLSRGESLELWRALGANGDGATRDAAVEEASGHPFLLAEMIRAARSPQLAPGTITRLDDALWRRVAERDVVERAFIEMTALAGSPTPYTVVAQAAGLDVGECLTRLSGLRTAHLVRLSRSDEGRCVEPYHDRIREAVMARLRERGGAALEELHLALGRAMLSARGDGGAAPAGPWVFPIVHHMNLARGRVVSDRETSRLAELNLIASRESHRATAFERARRYATVGVECLPPTSRGGETWRELHVALFGAEYLTLGRGAARATFDAVRAQTRAPVDVAAVCVPWIDLEAGNFSRGAVQTGREVLRVLGAPAPDPARKLHTILEGLGARRAQRGRPAAAFRGGRRLKDEALAAVLRTLAAMMPAAYFCEENLFPWMMLRMASISMRHGLSDESAMGFAGYGMVLTGALGRYADGAAFGRLAQEMARADRDPRVVAKVEFIYPAFLAPWVAPFHEARRGLLDAEEAAARCGDTAYQTNAVALRSELALTMGADLASVQADARRARDLSLRFRVQGVEEHAETVDRYVSALRGEAVSPLGFPAAWLGSDLALLRYHHLSAELGYLAGGDVREIERHLAEVERRSFTVFANPLTVEIRFLRALVAARVCASASPLRRLGGIVRVAREAGRLDRWARGCPANFEAHAWIVRGELARLVGRTRTALERFERAIASARRFGAPKREAIACELASEIARARGDDYEATRYRVLAIDAYRRWGATAKARMLERSGVGAPRPNLGNRGARPA
jgi:hypothetical protein